MSNLKLEIDNNKEQLLLDILMLADKYYSQYASDPETLEACLYMILSDYDWKGWIESHVAEN